ncbi:alpha/beta hydrolase-fold protein [Arenimonas sp.]|uniref:alpha/beta hydrolase n=1 Tax=Arenimonas sp. TaxID=1872635 RepID=UPI0039E5C30A
MIRRLLFLFFLLFVAVPAWAADAPPAKHTLDSAILGEQRTVTVHLPQSYAWAEDRRYPILYMLDGQTHAVHGIGAIAFLASQGQIPEMIVVAIDSKVRIRDFTQTDWPEAWIGGGGAGKFANFVEKELIPQVERAYRGNGYRILYGHSASGQFALHMLATRPTLFNATLAMSPSLDWDRQLPIREIEAAVAKPMPAARFVYFAYSDDRGSALADDERLVRALTTPGNPNLRAAVSSYPNERHSALPLVAQVEGLRKLYEGYELPESAPTDLASVQAHYDALGKLLGTPIAIPEPVLNDLGFRALDKDVAQATALFERATKENPNSPNAWDSLADAHAKAERWMQALDAEQRALDLATRFAIGNADYYRGQIEKYRAKLAKP